MRALVLGPDEEAEIRKLVEYAHQPEHWYHIGDGSIPGDNPQFVVHIPQGFRCVFTFTMDKGKLWRHLTVSVDGPKLPSPEAMVMLAQAFGFTSKRTDLDISKRMKEDGWLVAHGHEGEHCVVAVQEARQ